MSYEYLVTISTKSYTWWSDVSEGVDPRIPGFTSGILEEHSGTYDDFEDRGSGERKDDFTANRWYNKNRPNYAIDATGASVIAAVTAIDSNLPEGNQNALSQETSNGLENFDLIEETPQLFNSNNEVQKIGKINKGSEDVHGEFI